MKSFQVILVLLAGWLIIELKDFFTLGGASNQLAFTILRIVFILIMILLNVCLILLPDIFLEHMKSFQLVSYKENGLESKISKSYTPSSTPKRIIRTSRINSG